MTEDYNPTDKAVAESINGKIKVVNELFMLFYALFTRKTLSLHYMNHAKTRL